MNTVMDVIAGQSLWSAECAEALAWLRTLPERAAALWVTSPPYEDARTYGIGFKLRGQAWADWLRPIIVEMCRTSRGLVAVNMAGKVRDHRYSGAVEFLVADLLRLDGVVCGPSPYAWTRPGIAGSGSKHYHRRNWEPVYCFAFPDRLPLVFSDNTAFGNPPKWAPGGEMSHRLSNGERVNQWGRHSKGGKSKRADGTTQHGDRPSHQFTSKVDIDAADEAGGRDLWGMNGSTSRRRQGSGAMEFQRPGGSRKGRRQTAREHASGKLVEQAYVPPVVANPGNVIPTGNGGNQLGHPLAHDTEAPMNLVLAERFIRWFCPPGDIVGDPFLGSGTTIHAALIHGRRGIGCDIRPGKGGVATAVQRITSITPALFPPRAEGTGP